LMMRISRLTSFSVLGFGLGAGAGVVLGFARHSNLRIRTIGQ